MTTRKLAVFVEGQTEQIFMERLIQEMASRQSVHFVLQRQGPPLVTLRNDAQAAGNPNVARYLVLLFDCGHDERVKSAILDRRSGLESAGYELVLGLRDLYPRPTAHLNSVKRSLRTGVPTKGLPIHICLAVAEVEAWFLQDASHFQQIDARLDPMTFKTTFGFDPANESAEDVTWPAGLLNQIYGTVNKAYRKTRSQVQRTVDALDYAHLYLEAIDRLPHFKEFVAHLDGFFSTPAA